MNVEEEIADFSCEFSDPYKIRLSLDKKTMVDIEAFDVLGSGVGRLIIFLRVFILYRLRPVKRISEQGSMDKIETGKHFLGKT